MELSVYFIFIVLATIKVVVCYTFSPLNKELAHQLPFHSPVIAIRIHCFHMSITRQQICHLNTYILCDPHFFTHTAPFTLPASRYSPHYTTPRHSALRLQFKNIIAA